MEVQTVTKNALGGKNQENLEAYLEDIGAILEVSGTSGVVRTVCARVIE
jgi:hypothetical protein